VNKETYESWSRIVAFSLKMIGVLGIVFVPAFWALTGRIELAFLPFFGTLAGVGLGVDVLKEISQGSRLGGNGVSNET
jgi:hypothetical protein